MKKIIALLSVLTMLAMTVCLLGTVALAAEETITLNIADGAIIITETGYSIDGGAETAYTGSYIITGSANTTGPFKTLKVLGVASGSKVTLKDLTIITSGEASLTLNAPVEATGKLSVASAASPISGSTVTITGDAELDVTMTSGAPVFSCGTLNLTCKSIKMDCGMAASGSDLNITTTGDCSIKAKSPAFYGGSLTMNIGGALAVESGSNALALTTADITAGSIDLKSTGTAPTVSVDQVSLTATAGDITVTGSAPSPVTNTKELTMKASGDVTVANGGTHIGIIADALDVTAGGDITVTASNLAITSNSVQKQSLKAGGDVTVTSQSNLAFSGGNITVSGKNVTIKTGATTAPNMSCNSLDMIASGNVQMNGGYMALSVYNDVSVKAAGDISIVSAGTAPTISANQTTVKANGAVTMSNTGGAMIYSGSAISVEGSSVTVSSTGEDSVVFGGNASLKATAGDLTVNSSSATALVLGGTDNSLYAAEKIVIECESGRVSNNPPEMTFGQSIEITGGQQRMLIGLDRVAVEGQADYLPELKVEMTGMDTSDYVFTASLDGQKQTEIKNKGVYNCAVTMPGIGTALPFNLIVRAAKPAGNPSTGDSAPLAMFGLLALVSAAAAGCLLCSRKRYSV